MEKIIRVSFKNLYDVLDFYNKFENRNELILYEKSGEFWFEYENLKTIYKINQDSYMIFRMLTSYTLFISNVQYVISHRRYQYQSFRNFEWENVDRFKKFLEKMINNFEGYNVSSLRNLVNNLEENFKNINIYVNNSLFYDSGSYWGGVPRHKCIYFGFGDFKFEYFYHYAVNLKGKRFMNDISKIYSILYESI